MISGDSGGGSKKVIGADEGGGDKPSLFSLVFFRSFGLFCIRRSILAGRSTFFIRSLVLSLLLTLSCLSGVPTIGFLASNVETSSKTSLIGFFLLIIFLAIGSSFCLKLALLILSAVT